MKFLSPEVALYLYNSIIRPCMEYCYHAWAGAPSGFLELLDKLQKQIYMATSLEPLAHRGNLATLSLFYGRCSSELGGRSTSYSDRLHHATKEMSHECLCQQFLSSHR